MQSGPERSGLMHRLVTSPVEQKGAVMDRKEYASRGILENLNRRSRWPFLGQREPNRSLLAFVSPSEWPNVFLPLKHTDHERLAVLMVVADNEKILHLYECPKNSTMYDTDFAKITPREVEPYQLIAEGWLVD